MIELQFRTYHNDRATGIIDPLAQQVLPEPPLLPLKGVAQGLERSVVGTPQDPTPSPIVKQGIDRLLKHPLLIANDNLGGF